MIRLVGLAGAAGSGKDSSCLFLCEWGEARGLSVKRLAFADLLKWSAARNFFPTVGLEDAVAWCNRVKAHGTLTIVLEDEVQRTATSVSGRAFLQRYGSEAHRELFGHSFWVNACLKDLSADLSVVADVRYPNEAEAIRERGGEVWRLRRTGVEIAEGDHASEVSLPDSLVDREVHNDRDLPALREEVVALAARL